MQVLQLILLPFWYLLQFAVGACVYAFSPLLDLLLLPITLPIGLLAVAIRTVIEVVLLPITAPIVLLSFLCSCCVGR